MFWNRSPSYIIQHWQDDADQSLEAGFTPVIEFGASDLPTDSTLSLLALQRWSELRADVSAPVIPAGGVGPLWIATMMRSVPRYSQSHPPEPVVLYAGANEAEYLASVAMLHAAVDTSYPDSLRRAAIPASHFATWSQPGMTLSWDSLPFLDSPDWQVDAALRESTTEDIDTEAPDGDPLQDWLAWASLLLALCLILLAVVL